MKETPMMMLMSNKPSSCRPQTSIPKQLHNKDKDKEKDSKSSGDSSLKDITESERINQSSSKSITSKGNCGFDILDSVMKGKQKENFDNLIKEEANRLELIHRQKKNLVNINLYENNIEGLYDWKTLFNNSRPLSCYTKLNENVKVDMEENKKEFKFPIALIDASEDVVAQYIPYTNTNANGMSTDIKAKRTKGKVKVYSKAKGRPKTSQPHHSQSYSHSQGHNHNHTEAMKSKRKGNATRPQSMYSHRDPSDAFYLLKQFSDYYNEDLPTFSKKMPLVRAKVFAKTARLQKTLKAIELQTMRKENTLRSVELQEDLYVTPLELNIAGNLKNVKPLLKSIYKQLHPEEDYDFDPIRKRYLKSAKPLGNANGEIDYSKNNRSGHIEQIRKLRYESNTPIGQSGSDIGSDIKGLAHGLSLPTYDENDPEIQVFNRIKEVSIEEEHEAKQCYNYTTTNNEYTEEMLYINNNNNNNVIDYQKNGEKILQQQQTNKPLNTKPRPKTGIITTSGGFFSGRHLQSQQQNDNKRINKHNTRPMTANFNNNNLKRASKSTSAQINSTDLVSSYPNVNSSGSIKETCASSVVVDFIPVKAMPIRTTSAISNRTYQKINQNLKKKVKKTKDDYLQTEEFTRSASLAENKADVKIQATFRPLSSMYSNEYIKNKLDTINKNQRPEWCNQHISVPSTTGVNYIYFNNYIDSHFLPTTPNSNGNSKDECGYAKFKHFHEQNYYTTNCFNKGTCGRQLSGKNRKYGYGFGGSQGNNNNNKHNNHNKLSLNLNGINL